jgi:tRNA U34 5-methylaminomethyl-2-thiouridine-forming methyltransferase MnmC
MPHVNSPDFTLVQVTNGSWSVRSEADNEVFHPVIGPVAEAEALYVRQLRLPERFSAHPNPFVLWDVGLGAAANALTAIRSLHACPGQLLLYSFDHSAAPLAFALAHAEALEFPIGFMPILKTLLTEGEVRFQQGACEVTWRFLLGDFPEWVVNPEIPQSVPPPHAVLYDAYSPKKNPAMWALPHFQALRQRLMLPCSLATYSRSTQLRVTLLLAGFHVGIGEATGFKEETTVAATDAKLLDRPLPVAWLQRVRRSTAAAPIQSVGAFPAPLTAEDWDRLQAHPQFHGT